MKAVVYDAPRQPVDSIGDGVDGFRVGEYVSATPTSTAATASTAAPAGRCCART